MKNASRNKYFYLLFFSLLLIIFCGAMCAKEDNVPQIIVDQEVFKEGASPSSPYAYKNNTYGFTLEVPDEYQFSEKLGTLEGFASFELQSPDPAAKPVGNSLMKPDSARIVLSVHEMPEGALAVEYIPQSIHEAGLKIKDEEIGTAGNTITYRYQYVDSVGDAIEYLVEFPDGKILQITGYYGKGARQTEIMEQIYLIQDSFREI